MTSQCDCLPGCNSIKYKYQIDTIRKITEKEAVQFCKDKMPHHEYVRHTEKSYRGLKNIDDPALAYDTTFEYEKKRCQDYLKQDFALIKIRLEGSSYLRRVRSLKYKFFDKMFIVEGTLAFFSGEKTSCIKSIQGFLIGNCQNEMAVDLNWCIFDPMLVKPKCIERQYFQFLKFVYSFQLFVYIF